MTEITLDSLAARLDRLERSLRRWRAVGCVAWALLVGGVALSLLLLVGISRELHAPPEGAAQEDEAAEEQVVAKRFVLVDEDGSPRAALAIRADGSPGLAFSDKDGRIIWKAP